MDNPLAMLFFHLSAARDQYHEPPPLTIEADRRLPQPPMAGGLVLSEVHGRINPCSVNAASWFRSVKPSAT